MVAGLASSTFAAGFAVIEQSVSGLGNSFVGGAASAEDPTTIFYNPAGEDFFKGTLSGEFENSVDIASTQLTYLF